MLSRRYATQVPSSKPSEVRTPPKTASAFFDHMSAVTGPGAVFNDEGNKSVCKNLNPLTSRFWTPPTRPEQLKRAELDT